MNVAQILADMQARLANSVRANVKPRWRQTQGATPRQPMSLRRMKADVRAARYEDA